MVEWSRQLTQQREDTLKDFNHLTLSPANRFIYFGSCREGWSQNVSTFGGKIQILSLIQISGDQFVFELQRVAVFAVARYHEQGSTRPTPGAPEGRADDPSTEGT